ncbi:MAG TPA: hypothetical protein VN368_00485, partial [Candidatus Methylomirabilis sp.]|nr:hypothetical protein [Candidatus Methylomirabilis sp.]
NNTVINFTINSTISFTGKDIAIVSAPSLDFKQSIGLKNIGIYINTDNKSDDSWLFLNVSYTNRDITEENESLLRIYYRYKDLWELVPDSNDVNVVQNYVYANITSFGILAPLVPSQYSFNWDNIPGKDSELLINFLKYLQLDWVKKAKIEKIRNGRTIIVSTEKHYALLKLDKNERTLVIVIDDDVDLSWIASIAKINGRTVIIEMKELNPSDPGQLPFNSIRHIFEPSVTETDNITIITGGGSSRVPTVTSGIKITQPTSIATVASTVIGSIPPEIHGDASQNIQVPKRLVYIIGVFIGIIAISVLVLYFKKKYKMG